MTVKTCQNKKGSLWKLLFNRKSIFMPCKCHQMMEIVTKVRQNWVCLFIFCRFILLLLEKFWNTFYWNLSTKTCNFAKFKEIRELWKGRHLYLPDCVYIYDYKLFRPFYCYTHVVLLLKNPRGTDGRDSISKCFPDTLKNLFVYL